MDSRAWDLALFLIWLNAAGMFFVFCCWLFGSAARLGGHTDKRVDKRKW